MGGKGEKGSKGQGQEVQDWCRVGGQSCMFGTMCDGGTLQKYNF